MGQRSRPGWLNKSAERALHLRDMRQRFVRKARAPIGTDQEMIQGTPNPCEAKPALSKLACSGMKPVAPVVQFNENWQTPIRQNIAQSHFRFKSGVRTARTKVKTQRHAAPTASARNA